MHIRVPYQRLFTKWGPTVHPSSGFSRLFRNPDLCLIANKAEECEPSTSLAEARENQVVSLLDRLSREREKSM